jgi:hypothetical protein
LSRITIALSCPRSSNRRETASATGFVNAGAMTTRRLRDQLQLLEAKLEREPFDGGPVRFRFEEEEGADRACT